MIVNQLIDFSKVCLEPKDVNYVIYHGGNCPDGFGSALCAYKYFKDLGSHQPVFHAAKFGILPPVDEIKDKCVLICDFSYKKDILQKLLTQVKKLLILDHHKTAQDDLKDLPDENKIFRMDHSGAYITWKYFFRDTSPVPKGILYIEDNDIWKKEMVNTYEVTAFIFTLPLTFEAYEKLLDDNYILTEAIMQGIGIVKQNNILISKALKNAAPKFVQIGDKYYFVAHLNTTELKSELGNKVFSEYPNINFSLMYSHSDYNNSTSFSLRSLDTATDVSEIAKLYNGGGHRNASGAGCNYITNTLPNIVIDNHKSYLLLDSIYTKSHMIDNITCNTVYMNSSHYKHQLAKYLLQTRYTTSQGQAVQECVSIMTNRKDNSIKDSYHVSVIWSYDGFTARTWFTVHFKDLKDQSLKTKLFELLKGFDNFEAREDTFNFSCTGCKTDLSQSL